MNINEFKKEHVRLTRLLDRVNNENNKQKKELAELKQKLKYKKKQNQIYYIDMDKIYVIKAFDDGVVNRIYRFLGIHPVARIIEHDMIDT